MKTTVTIPNSRRSFSYDSSVFTAFRSRCRYGGEITLTDRSDGSRRFVLQSRASDRKELKNEDVIVKPEGIGLQTDAVISELLSSVVISGNDSSYIENLNVSVQGCFSKTNATLDIFVGPVENATHLDMIEIYSGVPSSKSTVILQRRALLAYSRAFSCGSFLWNSAAVKKGGFLLIQLPRYKFPAIDRDRAYVRLGGCFGTGEEWDKDVSIADLPSQKILSSPVPENWRMSNTPDMLSIHRFAVSIKEKSFFVAQRGAVDFNLVDGRQDVSEDPRQYPAFGKPIRSPCNGRVVVAEGEYDDQLVGERDDLHPRGNQVCIRRSDGLVLVLAHLKKGSLKVMEGDRVSTGQMIGEVGNSGCSSEPHVHMHLASSASIHAHGYIVELKPLL